MKTHATVTSTDLACSLKRYFYSFLINQRRLSKHTVRLIATPLSCFCRILPSSKRSAYRHFALMISMQISSYCFCNT